MYKIIIADDEKFIQEGLVNLIDWKSLGFEIAGVFEDGADVIEYLNTMPVDVVLTDIKMKHISGIVTAKYIYENEIPCKVVFISGYKEFDLVLQAIKYGVEDYIFVLDEADFGCPKGSFAVVTNLLGVGLFIEYLSYFLPVYHVGGLVD